MKNYKISFFIFFLLLNFSFASVEDEGLEYLNTLRLQAGLNKLSKNITLQIAAKNHADYLYDIYSNYNINIGHEEMASYQSQYYTGETPSKRGIAAGYKTLSYYRENTSSGQRDIYESIDGLMSAIYHRFGFLDFNIDEIGIGINSKNDKYKVYNYNMGISHMNELCKRDSFDEYGFFYEGVCENRSLRIEKSIYENAINNNSLNNPKYIVWPPFDSTDIPTTFYEEKPDPLPNRSISGYPISIEFNTHFYNTIDTLTISLFDENRTIINDTHFIDKSSDVNNKFTQFQFALFPLAVLNHNSKYLVEISYSAQKKNDEIENEKISWEFITR
jgi:hypothetical protein